MERVVDPGPIDYEQIELYKDRDLEEALEQDGLDPGATKYRLIELSVSAIPETKSMPWKHLGPEMVEALKAGVSLPPVVVVAGENGWVLLDGAHRTHAHWTLRIQTILAYELLTEGD